MTHWASFLDQSAYKLDKQIKQCKYGMNEYLCELVAVFFIESIRIVEVSASLCLQN
jgi:hypothetical protein